MGKGAILNYQNFFFDNEYIQFDVRCSKDAKVYYLSLRQLENIILEHEKLARTVLLFLNNLYKKKMNHPLDLLQSFYEVNRSKLNFR